MMVCTFFEHGRRQDKLVEVIEQKLPVVKRKFVKPFCRMVERHNALEISVDLYPATVMTLNDITYEDSIS